MRRNVTIALNENTARWLRVEAARSDMSVSQYLADLLEERRKRTEGYEEARDRFMSRRPRPLRRPGTPLPGRDEIQRRGG